jgi:curved DNA-binding protein CbpA
MSYIDYYTILGVLPTADTEVIAAAYRALAKKYHPDTSNLPKTVADEKFKELNNAFEILGNKERRQHYDSLRQMKFENDKSRYHTRTDDNSKKQWPVIIRRFPKIANLEQELMEISPALAAKFRLKVLGSRELSRFRNLHRDVLDEYLTKYFGDDAMLKHFVLWCFVRKRRDVVLDVTGQVKSVGTRPESWKIIADMKAKYGLNY